MTFRKLAITSSCVALSLLGSTSAQAAGFYIQEQSVRGLGYAFAGSVTALDDPSTAYFNPAGMTQLDGLRVQGAAHLLIPTSELTNTGSTTPGGGGPIAGGDGGNPYQPSPVPNFFATYQFSDSLWGGFGVTAPFGLANEYDSDWFGRYDSIETDLTVIDFSPALAFKVNDALSIGGGINIQYADAKLTSAAFGGGTEGVSTLEGDSIDFGYNLGVRYQPREGTILGASYRSAVSHELDGRISARGTTNADFDVSGRADLDLPDIATFGASQAINSKWRVMGQATWFGWNNFQDITAITDQNFSILGGGITRAPGDVVSSVVQNYQTTWAYALGVEYDYSDTWTLRGGVQFDETPTTDLYRTSRTPDGDRTWIAAGATHKLKDNLELDLAATYIFIEDEEINVTRNNSFSAAVANTVSADTEGSVGIIAIGLTYKF
jgi:long-chain fatty acid transport protein